MFRINPLKCVPMVVPITTFLCAHGDSGLTELECKADYFASMESFFGQKHGVKKWLYALLNVAYRQLCPWFKSVPMKSLHFGHTSAKG